MPKQSGIPYARHLRRSGALYRDAAKIDDIGNLDGNDQPGTSRDDQITPSSDPVLEEITGMDQLPSLDIPSGEQEDEEDLFPDEYIDAEPTFEEEIRYFVLMANLPHCHINLLLRILRRHTTHTFPKDARTFLETYSRTNNREVANIAGGQFWYHGIKECFDYDLSHTKAPAVDTVHINICVNGLPLFKSSRVQFWPILMNIFELPEAPVMVIGIFCGRSKPVNLEEYLRPLTNELNHLYRTGVFIGKKNVQLRLRAIIADSPAHAFVKGVASFNARNGCLKCTGQGWFHGATRKVVFPPIAGPLRTDHEFRSGVYGNNHHIETPLMDIEHINMIEDIVIAERLHLVDHGITKKLLGEWCNGRLGGHHRWSLTQKDTVSGKLLLMQLPSEINWKLRSLNDMPCWKGTEFRSFLHYASVGLLRDSLSQEAFDHFMKYFCAITIFSSNAFREHWRHAGTLLEQFVSEFDLIYGEGNISSNVHQLLHVYDDIVKFGNLETISSYRFESHMQQLKRMLRSGYNSLQQIVNRSAEMTALVSVWINRAGVFPQIKIVGNQTVLHLRRGFSLRADGRNSWFLTKDRNIAQFNDVHEEGSLKKIICRRLIRKANMFEKPVSAAVLHMYVGRKTDLSEEPYTIPFDLVMCKLVAIERSGDLIDFIPLSHTLGDK